MVYYHIMLLEAVRTVQAVKSIQLQKTFSFWVHFSAIWVPRYRGCRPRSATVHTQIMVMLNVAQKWAVSTACNTLVMLFVCLRKTLFGGIIWAGIGHNG